MCLVSNCVNYLFRHAKYDATRVATLKVTWTESPTYQKMMQHMEKNFEGAVNCLTSNMVRDFIMCSILVGGSGPRGEAVCNMTIPELEQAEEEGAFRVVYVKDHKTDFDGPVVLPLPSEIHKLTM